MARNKREEQSFEAWFFGLLVTCAVIFGAYKYITHVTQSMGQDIIQKSHAASQRILEQHRQMQQAISDQHEQESKRAAQAVQVAEARSQYEARKSAAWTTYFKPSRKCALDPITVECGNEYMRAKSRFEETYKDTQ